MHQETTAKVRVQDMPHAVEDVLATAATLQLVRFGTRTVSQQRDETFDDGLLVWFQRFR